MSNVSPRAVSIDASKQGPGPSLVTIVARNASFVLGTQVALKVLALLFNIYVVRRLGAVHFGQYAAVLAYLAIFGIFTDLGLAPYSVREMAEDHEKTSWLLPNIVAIRLVLSLVVTVVAPLSAYWLGREHDMVIGILIASAGQFIYAFKGPLDSALTARERLDYTATFLVVNQLIFWGLGVLLLINGMGFIGLIIASLIGVAVVTLLSGCALFRQWGIGRLMLSLRRWPQLLLDALPFGVFGIADAFIARFDTVLMSFVLTDAAVGWYNAPYTLVNMMLLIAQSIAIAMYPSMVRGYKADPASLRDVTRRSIKYLLIICLPVAAGGTILADQIITTLYTDAFVNSVPVLQLMLWALPSLFLLELLGRAANALHLERAAAKANVINAGVAVFLNLVLVPTLGVMGGALALVVGRAIRLGQFWFLIGNDQLIGSHWKPLFRVVLAAALMGGVVFFLRNTSLFLCIGCGAIIYTGLLLVLQAVDRDELRFASRMLLRRTKLERMT